MDGRYRLGIGGWEVEVSMGWWWGDAGVDVGVVEMGFLPKGMRVL